VQNVAHAQLPVLGDDLRSVTAPRTPCAEAARRMPSRCRYLRIGVIAPPFFPIPPAGYGGTERVVAAHVEGLVAVGHNVTLFAAAGSDTAAGLVTPLDSPPILGDLASITDELSTQNRR
jgi:hypothetical protein